MQRWIFTSFTIIWITRGVQSSSQSASVSAGFSTQAGTHAIRCLKTDTIQLDKYNHVCSFLFGTKHHTGSLWIQLGTPGLFYGLSLTAHNSRCCDSDCGMNCHKSCKDQVAFECNKNAKTSTNADWSPPSNTTDSTAPGGHDGETAIYNLLICLLTSYLLKK